MTIFVVLASGPSMSQELADFVRGKCRVIAVSDTFRLAPWADAVVSHDSIWWQAHPDALRFAGRKFSGRKYPGVELLPFDIRFTGGTNSGLQGMRVAKLLGAGRILLLGFDLSADRGSHYFGNHPAPLRTTTPGRFKAHIRQFRKWDGPPVINCTELSALTQFPMSTIERELSTEARVA